MKYFCFITVLIFCIVVNSTAQWLPLEGIQKKERPKIKVLSSDNTGILIGINLPGIETAKITAKGTEYDLLRLPEYFTTLEIGKPQLPAIRELLAIGAFKNYKFSVVDSSVTILKGYNVYPFQTPALEGENLEFVKDEMFYDQNKFYPDKILNLEKPGIWRDLLVSRLSIFPIKYNPKTKILRIFTKLLIKIDFEGSSGDAKIRNKPIPKEWKNIYKNSIINYDYLHLDRIKLNKCSSSKSSSGDYDYLIITHQDYYTDIQRLAAWKTRKGLLSKVVNLNDIGNNQTDIKDYITDEYNDHNISYVLLVGDINQLCWSTTGPGDYWYSDLSGDLKPEISVGRISVTSTSELKHVLDKGMNYEISPPIDNWVRKSLLVAHKEDAPGKYQGCKENIRTYSYSDPPVFITAYGASTSNGGDEATNSNVSTDINSGMGVVNYRGHGGYNKWYHWNTANEDYTTSNARALTNGDKTPVVFSIACSNAKLDDSNECLAEAFSKADDAATAILGATRPSYTSANHAYDEKLFSTAFDSDINYIGGISNEASKTIITQYGSYGEQNAKMYLWLGEPSIELWTNTLQQYTNVQITDNGSSITVNSGIGGSDICVSSSNNGDDYYEVETNTSSHTFSGISSSDRPLYITVTKHNYIPYTAVTGGTFTTNQYWLGNIDILENVIINSGVSLTIDPGTVLSFKDDKNITVNGTLDAQGTASNPITFDLSGTSGTWGGIQINGTANISHAIIEHADKGVQFNYNSSGSVSNSEIKNNNYGVYVYKSKPTIQNCDIHDNDSRGIYLSSTNYISGDAQILNNQIYDNDEYGIDMHQSSPDIRGNEIYNHDYGISCYGFSSPYLGEYNIRGNNEIHDNDIGLETYDLCDPFLGQENCDSDGGYNSFEDNNYHVWAEMDCDIQAEENWWGSNPPNSSKFYMDESDIDYNPWLHSAPSGSSMLAKSGGEAKAFDSSFNQTQSEDTVSTKDFMSYYDPKWPIEQKLLFARNISHLGDIKNAQAICKDIIETYPDSSLSFFGLDILWESSRDEKAPEGYDLAAFQDYVTKLASNKDKKELYDHAALVQAGFDQGKSISIYDRVYNENKENSISEVALYDKFMRYYQDGDMENAQQIATQLENEYPKSISARKAKSQMSDTSPEMKKEKSGNENATILGQFSISANYPNPFNPSTTVRYQIPAEANVQFKIYNSLGQVIKTYSENKSKGVHIFIWDGKNNNGINVPSGLYILKFKAQTAKAGRTSFSKIIKMLLIR